MVRQIRLIVLAVASFLTITARAFPKKTVVFALCGILSFNAAICYSYLRQSIKANAALPLANTASTAIVTDDKEVAQSRIPGLDLPVPGSGSVNDLLKGVVAEQVLKLIGNEAPIVSSADEIFPTVSSLPGVPFTPKQRSSVDDHQVTLVAALPESSSPNLSLTSLQDIAEIPRIRRQNREPSPTTPADDNAPVQPGKTTDTSRYPFNPTGNVSQLVAQLRQSPDGSVLLKPGDYAIPITLYCMKQRASSPAGHRYLLAPLKGSKADVISALNARAAGSDVPHGKLQALSWNIQAGMKYEEMSSDQQGLVNQMIPSYRDRLSRSFLEQVEAGYNQIATVSNLPSLDAAINRLGKAGTIIRQYREFRNTLVRYRDNYQALLEELVPGGGSRVVGGAANTPWSKINNQVYARMITQEKVGGTGELQMRVLPSSASDPSPVRVGITNIVADSQSSSIQPLTGSPEPPPKSNDVASEELQEAREIARQLREECPRWKVNLPKCPCREEAIQASDDVFEPAYAGLETYHPGAESAYRSREPATYTCPTTGQVLQPGQQCTYRAGILITGGAGAGTPDAYSPNSNSSGYSRSHIRLDVKTAAAMTWQEYHQTWTPDKGINDKGKVCPVNIVPPPGGGGGGGGW